MRSPLLLLSCLCLSATALTVQPTGPPLSVWGSIDALHKCGVNDVPDIPARAFVDSTGLAHMIVGSTSFHVMTGPTVFNQTRSCASSWNSTQSPVESDYAAAQWLDSPFVFPNGTVIALVHNEYPDNSTWRTSKNCTRGYPYCWQASVGLAISQDWGLTWGLAAPPPGHLVAAVPYKVNASQLASGWGDPSNIFLGPGGLHHMAVLNRNAVGLQPPGICFSRTPDLTDPKAWRAHGGGGAFNVTFASPFDVAPGAEAAHICAVAAGLPPCMPSGVVWSTYLQLYVITMDCLNNQGGVFLSTSGDLLQWSPPVEFYTRAQLPPDVARNVTSMTYPTFIDPAQAQGGNFMAIGQSAPLFWVSIGHSPYTDGRRVWATPMTFSK